MLQRKKITYFTAVLLFLFVFGSGSNHVFAQITIQRVKAVPARGSMEDIMNNANDYDEEEDVDEEEVEEEDALKMIPKKLDENKKEDSFEEQDDNDTEEDMMDDSDSSYKEDKDDLSEIKEKAKERDKDEQNMFIRARAFEVGSSMFFDIDWEGEDKDNIFESVSDKKDKNTKKSQKEKMRDQIVWGVLSEKEDDYSSLPLGMAIAVEGRKAPLFLPGVYLEVDKDGENGVGMSMLNLEVDARSLRWAADNTKEQIQQILNENQDKLDMDILGLQMAQMAIANPVIEKIKIESPSQKSKGKIKIEYRQPLKFLGIFDKTVPAVLEVDDDCDGTSECEVDVEYNAPWWLQAFSLADRSVIDNLTKSAKELKKLRDNIFGFFN